MTDKAIAVQRMQDYIETHLSESITLSDLKDVRVITLLQRKSLEPVADQFKAFSCSIVLKKQSIIQRLKRHLQYQPEGWSHPHQQMQRFHLPLRELHAQSYLHPRSIRA